MVLIEFATLLAKTRLFVLIRCWDSSIEMLDLMILDLESAITDLLSMSSIYYWQDKLLSPVLYMVLLFAFRFSG